MFGKVIQELDRFSEIRGNGYQLAVKGQLFLFCIMLMAEASCLQRRSRDMQERNQGILEYIREHFGEEITDQAGGRAVLLQ